MNSLNFSNFVKKDKMKLKPITILLGIILTIITMPSCRVGYSFTGASIPPQAKTISIHFFRNIASLVNPTLSQQLTDALRDRFSQQTNLTLVNNNGDLDISGEITNYVTNPTAIQATTETPAMNQLSISINVKFTNKFNEQQNFETPFTRFESYPSNKNLADVEPEIVPQIIEYLLDDIFNKSVVNW